MKIEKIEIKGLFGKKDISWELNPQVNVLVGVNGSGKSTILSMVHNLLFSIEFDTKNMFLFHEAKILFDNGELQQYIPIPFDEFREIIKKLATKGKKGETFIMEVIALIQSPDFNEDSYLETIKGIRGSNLQDKLHIDLIEANLANSNSNQTITRSNGEKENVLDLEIRETIEKLNRIANPELIDQLTGSLNIFFNQIGKHVSYENHELVYTDTQLQQKLNYSHLSSGERQLIYILLRVALSNGDKSKTAIILMDEPEISLHLDWQEHFIKQLTILNPDAQFIIVTHSPALIMNGWNDVYVDMEEITTWQ